MIERDERKSIINVLDWLWSNHSSIAQKIFREILSNEIVSKQTFNGIFLRNLIVQSANHVRESRNHQTSPGEEESCPRKFKLETKKLLRNASFNMEL